MSNIGMTCRVNDSVHSTCSRSFVKCYYHGVAREMFKRPSSKVDARLSLHARDADRTSTLWPMPRLECGI